MRLDVLKEVFYTWLKMHQTFLSFEELNLSLKEAVRSINSTMCVSETTLFSKIGNKRKNDIKENISIFFHIFLPGVKRICQRSFFGRRCFLCEGWIWLETKYKYLIKKLQRREIIVRENA